MSPSKEKSEYSKYDWETIAEVVRFGRMTHNITYEELAKRSQVALRTIYRIAAGKSVSPRTLTKVARGLNYHLHELVRPAKLRIKSQKDDYIVHKSEDSQWYMLQDKRRNVPDSNQELIASKAERLRLGHLGLVTHFYNRISFIMPDGPGMFLLEIYDEDRLGPGSQYNDFIFYCLRGPVIVKIANDEFVMNEGDAMGTQGRQFFRVGPATPIGPEDEPALMMVTAANRIGPALVEGPKRFRATGDPNASDK